MCSGLGYSLVIKTWACFFPSMISQQNISYNGIWCLRCKSWSIYNIKLWIVRHTSKENGEHEDDGGEKYGSIENAEKKAQYQDGLHKEQY